MPGITRRRLTTAVASAGLLAGRRASAQTVSEATRNLPRTYSGTKLNMAWGTGQVNAAMIEFSREFTDATGIQLAFTSLNSDDLQQKTILDTATKTNAFDVYLNAYQWKQEIGPYLADLSHIEQEVKGCPPLDLDDFPKGPLWAKPETVGASIGAAMKNHQGGRLYVPGFWAIIMLIIRSLPAAVLHKTKL